MRIIFSVEIEIEPPAGVHSACLIVPLDRAGQGVHTREVPPKHRVIDLRVGDYLMHRAERRKILGVKAYREWQWPDDNRPPAVGYIVGRPAP